MVGHRANGTACLYSIHCNPLKNYEFVVCGTDKNTRMFDQRKISQEKAPPVFTFCPNNLLVMKESKWVPEMSRIFSNFILWFWKIYRPTKTQVSENIIKVLHAPCLVITVLKYSRHTMTVISTCSMRPPAKRFIVTTVIVILLRVSVTFIVQSR